MYYNQKEFTTQPLAEEFLTRNGYLLTPKAFLVSLPKGLTKKLGFNEPLFEMLENSAIKAMFLMYAGFLYKKEWGSIERDTLAFVGKQIEGLGYKFIDKANTAQEIADKVVETLQYVRENYCEYAYCEPEKGFYTIAYRKAGKEKPLGKHYGCTSYMLGNFFGDPVSTETTPDTGTAISAQELGELQSDTKGWQIVEVANEDGTAFYAQKSCKETGFYCKIVRSVSKKYYVLNIYEAKRPSEWLFADTDNSTEAETLYEPIYKHSMWGQLVDKDDYSFVEEAERRIANFAKDLERELAKTWDFSEKGTISRLIGESGFTLSVGYENLALLWCALKSNNHNMPLCPMVQLTRAIQNKPTASELFQIITWAEDQLWGIGRAFVKCNTTYKQTLKTKW